MNQPTDLITSPLYEWYPANIYNESTEVKNLEINHSEPFPITTFFTVFLVVIVIGWFITR